MEQKEKKGLSLSGLSWPLSVSLLSLIKLPAHLGFVPSMSELMRTLHILDPPLGIHLPHVSGWLTHFHPSHLRSEACIPREVSLTPTPVYTIPVILKCGFRPALSASAKSFLDKQITKPHCQPWPGTLKGQLSSCQFSKPPKGLLSWFPRWFSGKEPAC